MRHLVAFLVTFVALVAAIPSIAQPAAELRSRYWALQSIEYPGGVHQMPWPSYPAGIYFRDSTVDGDATLFSVALEGGCTLMEGKYRIHSDSTIAIESGQVLGLSCSASALEANYYAGAARVRFFQVGGDRMRLWSADSSIILHFGVTLPRDHGHQVQLVNLIRGTRRLELFAGDAAHSLDRSDTFARASYPHYLDRSTRRIAIAFRDSGYATRFFDTTLAEGSRSILFVAVTDASGAPRIVVLDRARAPGVGADGVVRVVHASAKLGDALMRLERRSGVLVGTQRTMRFGEATAPEPTPQEQMRLRLAIGSSAIAAFRVGEVRSGSAATHLILGSVEGGDLESWRFDDQARQPRSLTRALPSPSLIAARYVNLEDDEVSVTMQTIPVQRVPSMSVSTIDVDFDASGGITIHGWDGRRLDSIPMSGHHAGLVHTFVRYHDTARAWIKEHAPSLSEHAAPDSTILRVVYGARTWRYVWVEAADRTFEAGTVGDPPTMLLRAGSTRITVMRPGAPDTPLVSFLVPLPAGGSVTVILSERGEAVAAHLFVDSDPRAQSPMPSLAIVPTVTPPVRLQIDSAGRLLLVNAARGDHELVHKRFYVTTWVRPGETGRRDLAYPPGPNNGSIAVVTRDGPSPRILAEDVTVARDTTTILVTVGFEPSIPWRLLRLGTPLAHSEADTAPRLRILGALDDTPAIDVVAHPGPRPGVEQRIIRDEWTESLPASSGLVRIDVLTPAGELLFSAHDTLEPGHRYTAILAGERRSPVVFLLDDDAGSGPMRRSVVTLAPSPAAIGEVHCDIHPHVAPNPASGTLVIRGAARSSALRIVDDLGRVVLRETLKGGMDQVDVSGLPGGGYTVVASGVEGIIWVERVVVR